MLNVIEVISQWLGIMVEAWIHWFALPLLRIALFGMTLAQHYVTPYFGLDGQLVYADTTHWRHWQYGNQRNMSAVVVEPANKEVRGVVVHCHGGGFVATQGIQYVHSVEFWARQGFVVVAVNFPNAPEAPFPEGDLIVIHALKAVRRDFAEACAAPHGLVLTGESTGTNVALRLAACLSNPACMKELQQAGRRMGLEALTLELLEGDLPTVNHVIGMGGMMSRGNSMGGGMLKGVAFRALWRWYEPTGKEQLAAFDGVLESGLVKSMPKTLLCVGGDDFVLADSTRVLELMRARSLPVDMRTYDGCPHGLVPLAAIVAGLCPWLMAQAQRCITDQLNFVLGAGHKPVQRCKVSSWAAWLHMVIFHDLSIVACMVFAVAFLLGGHYGLALLMKFLVHSSMEAFM